MRGYFVVVILGIQSEVFTQHRLRLIPYMLCHGSEPVHPETPCICKQMMVSSSDINPSPDILMLNHVVVINATTSCKCA